jgi:hypothetical protein
VAVAVRGQLAFKRVAQVCNGQTELIMLVVVAAVNYFRVVMALRAVLVVAVMVMALLEQLILAVVAVQGDSRVGLAGRVVQVS